MSGAALASEFFPSVIEKGSHPSNSLQLQNVAYAAHAPPKAFGTFAVGAAAHLHEGVAGQCNVGRYPNRFFVQAVLGEAAIVGSAGVAAKRLPDERLIFSAEFRQIRFLAGIQGLKCGGAPLDKLALPPVLAWPRHASILCQLHRHPHHIFHARTLVFVFDFAL